MALYDVRTDRFGTVVVSADSVKGARKWAREAMGVGPQNVSVHAEPKEPCSRCDSRPCVCEVRA